MPTPSTRSLPSTLAAVADKARRYRDRGLGEQNTKASLIEPLLTALGWDTADPEEVHREFRPTPRDSPVDYALTLRGSLRLFIEAKGLGEDLSERRWIRQVIGYAGMAGVPWCVLTDGDRYRFYNAAAGVEADQKLFCEVSLSRDELSGAAGVLELISKGNLGDDLISRYWNAHYVDRRVRGALRELLGGPEAGLVRLIRRKVPALKTTEIAESVRRLGVSVDPPRPPTPTTPAARAAMREPRREGTRRPRTATQADASRSVRGLDETSPGPDASTRPSRDRGRRGDAAAPAEGATLADLIASGVLRPPVTLTRRFKGTDLTATVRPDGSVEVAGAVFATPSAAAMEAVASVTGRRTAVNGWAFWTVRDRHGRSQSLGDLRPAPGSASKFPRL